MIEFGLVEPFEIDRGELDGLSRQECFAMGVEWQMFRQKLATDQPFADVVLSNNAARLEKLAERAGRFVETRPASQGWTRITVGGYRVWAASTRIQVTE